MSLPNDDVLLDFFTFLVQKGIIKEGWNPNLIIDAYLDNIIDKGFQYKK